MTGPIGVTSVAVLIGCILDGDPLIHDSAFDSFLSQRDT